MSDEKKDKIMNYNAQQSWSREYRINQCKMAYPAEYVIRIFKGQYPRLNLREDSFAGKKICDIGCGDGRNLKLLRECGFDVYGIEITEEIVDGVRKNLAEIGISDVAISVGTNSKLPYPNQFFDYVLSWNACYYMGELRTFEVYVDEFTRVIKQGGYLILSIPKKSCFIYHGAEVVVPGYVMIKNDPFEIRNGEVLRIFDSEQEIKDAFSPYFKNFRFGSIHDDCFGYDYHWHLVVCQRA